MAFNSAEFVIFAAAVITAYYLFPKKARWTVLLAASTLFYLSAGVFGIVYLLSNITVTYFSARLIGRDILRQDAYLSGPGSGLGKDEKKAYREGRRRYRKRIVLFCVLFDVAVLAAGKYIVPSALGGSDAASALGLIFPLGVSFFTLQSIGYLVDVYRGAAVCEKNYLRFALFVSYFPGVVQGPISRCGDLSKELFSGSGFDGVRLCRGVMRMLWGYFKKMVVADRVGVAVAAIVASADRRGVFTLVLLLFYTVQLYADFTGGIDIAIGLSEALGVRLAENFDLPYFSCSLKEYWRRWHMTMCSWFRDYVFYPVSTSKLMGRISSSVKKRFGKNAGRRVPLYLSTFTVWLLTGLWHGVGANFVVWGLLNWLVLMVSEELEPLYARFHKKFAFSGRAGYRVFEMFRTFALVCVLNLFDCFARVGETLGALASLFTVRNAGALFDGSLMKLGLGVADYAVLAAGVAAMLAVSLFRLVRKKQVRDAVMELPYPAVLAVLLLMSAAVIVFGAYGVGYDAGSFIYNRF